MKHSVETSSDGSTQATCSIRTMTDTQKALFKFTGKLRPGLISPIRKVPAEIRRPDYALRADGASPSEEQAYRTTKIPKYNDAKLEAIRSVGKIGRKVLEAGIAAAVVGATTESIDEAVHKACIEHNVYPSTLNYLKFPKSCCTSINEVVCHGIPDSTVLQEGDIINLDISCYSKDGVHTDLNETIFVGKPSEEDIKLVHVTYEAMMLAIRTVVKPDAMYKHIGDVIGPFVEAHGFSAVRDICAHGVGELFHTNPSIPHYKGNKAAGKMLVGHVFTIEPMVNAGKWQDVTWPDNWTITTKDGTKSAQFEHTMTVTPNGAEIFTASADGRPYYQVQLEAWGIPLPSLGTDATQASSSEATSEAKKEEKKEAENSKVE